MKGGRKVRRTDLLLAGLRAFYLQGSWNYERMQALGFCFSLVPVARRLSGSKAELVSFMRRHLGFFNTNPVMASYAIGATARLEEDRLSGKGLSDEELVRFKGSISSFFGSVGDELFWGTLRPLSALLGILLVSRGDTFAGVVFLLVSYNVPHLYYRLRGVFSGYDAGLAVTKTGGRISPLALSKWLGITGAFLGGTYTAAFFLMGAGTGSKGAILFLGGALVSYYLLRKRILGATAVAIILTLAVTLLVLFACILTGGDALGLLRHGIAPLLLRWA
ncbi:MAG: PTS system mannose/fructose/sorbose family transporter subunit IID [Candidatus Eisenbacteria bacterium]|nr:PTS system mannose/fructose/sorbose family transporter subunit IID [Candidatus Eisenbacteria bacterium]